MPSRALRRGAFAAAATMTALALPSAASADVTLEVRNNTLFISSDADADRLLLDADPNAPASRVSVLVNEIQSHSFDRATFGRIQVNGGEGNDRVQVQRGSTFTDDEPLTANLGPGSDTFVGGDGEETVLGEEGGDDLSGGEAEDTLLAGPGDDRVRGGLGNDLVTGGTGRDSFRYDMFDGADEVRAGDDRDTLTIDGTDQRDTVNVDHDAQGNMSVRVLAPATAVTSALDVEVLDFKGRGDRDVLAADPTLQYDLAASGDEGDDFLSGGPGADRILGGDGADAIRGGAGDDKLEGGPQNDALDGGEGADELLGGTGVDIFECDAFDTVGDLEPIDAGDGCATPRPPTPTPAPAPEPGPGAGAPDGGAPAAPVVPGAPAVPAQPQLPPAGGAGELPRGALGFTRPRIAFARTGLKVTLRNTHSAPIRVALGASEKRGRKLHRYARVTRTIAAGQKATVTLKAPRALLRQLKARAAGGRRATVTATNLATGGKLTVRR